ncbi:MAG: ferritin-like domain-containing protein [Pseudomonadota bacterium]|nr:ferritin-like domain-containing protein [Pseudomonadota bacterium]
MRRSSLTLLRLALLGALGACDLGKPDLCPDGESLLFADGSASGYERCADGAINRVEAMAVDPTITAEACAGTEGFRACETDSDCTDGPHGKCITGVDDYSYGTEDPTICGCEYSCATDADCASTQACVPPGVVDTYQDWPVCVTAACTDNADCDSGECGLGAYDSGCGLQLGLECREADDDCRVREDCGVAETCWDGDAWACGSVDCAIGRPLLVAGVGRTAPPTARGDWAGALDAATAHRLAALPADTRHVLATHWGCIAALEHASVGSFARFTLQLLALGAPPELLAAAQAAAADEVRHARFAYAMASACQDTPVGPGRLALGDAAPGLDPRAVMHALVAEACIGETLGAAEVAAAADATTDPALAEALRAIAADETRHAALAWRALRWIVTDVAPELRDEARAALQAGMARGVDVAPGPHLPEEGLLGPVERARVHRAALATVVVPCIEAALGGSAAAAHTGAALTADA